MTTVDEHLCSTPARLRGRPRQRLGISGRRRGDRQELHERIRRHAQKAGEQVKKHGRPNDLIERLKSDPALVKLKWSRVLDPRRYTGLAAQQTREYLRHHARPLLKRSARDALRPEDVRV